MANPLSFGADRASINPAHYLRFRQTLVWSFVFFWTCVVDGAYGQTLLGARYPGKPAVVYEEADKTSRILERMSGSAQAELLDEGQRWYRVRLEDSTVGFVSRYSVVPVRVSLPERQSNELRIHYLNVGAGACTVVQCPGTNTNPIIIDCGTVGRGNGLSPQKVKEVVTEIVEQHHSPPQVLLSHPHLDHYSYIPTVLENTRVSKIWLGGQASGYRHKGFPEWISEQRSEGAIVFENQAENFHNDREPLTTSQVDCGDASVFSLTLNVGDNPNANSHMLEIRYGEFGATFTGDAEGVTERSAMENFGSNVKTTVLSSSHHGADSHGTNSASWLNYTSPEIVIFTAGQRFSHPRCTVTEALESHLAPAPPHLTRCGDRSGYHVTPDDRLARYVTATNGTVVVTTNGLPPARIDCVGNLPCSAAINH